MTAEPIRFDEYILESLLGEGGMGRVYRARQVSLDRWVALKILPRAKDNQTFIDRFYREARSAARLIHSNIVQIYTVGEKEGIPYFAMEYVEGEDVEHLLRPEAGEPLNLDEIIEIVRSVTKAMNLASEHGIVHRDIKPANIMVTRNGVVKVMDFGLAKSAAIGDHVLTQQGLIVGTPAYMSPEQGASKPVDVRSDLYSLGCVMYECLAGRPPFVADSVASLIFKHMYENPEPINHLRPEIPPEVEAICQKMLAKNIAERYQTPTDLLEALAQIPVNGHQAELTLAKRIARMLQNKPKPVLGVNPEDLGIALTYDSKAPTRHTGKLPALAPLPGSEPESESIPQNEIATPPVPVEKPPHVGLQRKAAPVTAPLPSPTTPPLATPLAPPTPSPASVLPNFERTPSSPSKRPSGIQIPPPPPPTPLLPGAAGAGLPALGGSSFKLGVLRNQSIFFKLPDGRWSYKLEMGRCPFAEGLALEAPTIASDKLDGLGDCLLCSNWNKRTGCTLAFSEEIETSGRYRGLRLSTEQAIAFAGAGRYDKAINILDTYVKQTPDDAEGYRELARIYDRPEYKGKDKRRAIVLYQRFVELARRIDGFSTVEISRAEERITALKSAVPESRSSGLHAGIGIPFACFYRGGSVCFVFGLMTSERLVLARAGDVDPDSGIESTAMSGAMARAASIFRHFKSDAVRKEEQTQVRKELLRLANLMPDQLQRDAARILSITFDQITQVQMSVDAAVGIRCVKITTQQGMHELLFTEAGAYRADQCLALIQRKRGL